MKKLYTLFLGLCYVSAFAQEPPKNLLETKIQQVKVFLNSAEINRSGSVNLMAGDTTLIIANLSPYMDKKSIQVKGTGNFKILAVNHQYDYLNEKTKTEQVKKLNDSIGSLQIALKKMAVELDWLDQKIDFLNKNKRLSPEKLANVEDLSRVLDFYATELQAAQHKKLNIELSRNRLQEKLAAYEKELVQTSGRNDRPNSEIHILVRVEKAGKADFKISYLAKNAGWFPKYDIRAKDVSSPIEIDYKASLYQNTGEDWHDVKLIFSNINADETGLAPELTPWKLNFDRYTIKSDLSNHLANVLVNEVKGRVTSAEDGSGIPGVNVVVKGSTTGAVTDIEGNYAVVLPNGAKTLVFSFIGMQTEEIEIDNRSVIDVSLTSDAQQLSEVVVTAMGISREKASLGYAVSTIDFNDMQPGALRGRVSGVNIRGNSSISGSRRTKTMTRGTRVENQTSVDFVINERYSLKSNGRALLIDLKQYVVEGVFEYYSVPKLNSSVFLIAKIFDWNKFGFLEGEANLYFEEAFVGKSILDTKTTEDTLRVSLGKDRSVHVQRDKNEEFSKRKAVGNNNLERTGIKLTLKNNKDQPIMVNLFDQIPISVNNAINVHLVANEEGEIDKQEGIIKWQVALQPNETKVINFVYEVKYPAYEKISLE